MLMLFFLVSILFFVYFTSTGVEENVNDLKTELEKAEAQIYTPMGIFKAFMQFLLSLFP